MIVTGEIDGRAPVDDVIGQRCGGSFQIVRLLGEGGMGAVYMAESVGLAGKRIAVKVLPRELCRPGALARFAKEAFAASSVNDPAHVVEVLDAGDLANGRPYMMLEYCDAGSLHDLLARQPQLSFDRVLEIIEPICHALSSAHRARIVHRDLKPANILFKSDRGVPRAKLADFGIAKLLDDRLALTSPLATMGSPGYMAPEQCDPRAVIDHRADIYALGRVLYVMVTGSLPHRTESSRDEIQLKIGRAHV